MRELESLASEAVEYARARGAECEVWLERRTATEHHTVRGETRLVSGRNSLTATVTTWRHGHEGCAVSQGAEGLTQSVDEAIALGGVLPRRDRPVRTFTSLTADPAAGEAGSALPADGDIARLEAVSARSCLIRDLTLEACHASTAFAESGGAYLARRSSRTVVQARFSASAGNSALTRSFVGRNAASGLTQAEDALDECLRHTAALAEPTADWKPAATVLLHGSVMVRLLTLLAPSLQLDSVAQRKSRLAGLLGEEIAAPGFCLADDAPGRSGPVAFAFDDEGTPTRTARMIDGGRLHEFISDARHAVGLGLESTGAGWRSAAGGEVRIRPGALIAGWNDSLAPAGTRARLHVLQATGMHISNDVTGDFSFGAVGVLDDGSGPPRNAGSFTVAGNVIDMLKDLRPVKSPVRHIARSVGICASPDITVTGLVVGK